MQYGHSHFLSPHTDFLTARLLHLIASKVVSIVLEIVETNRIDLELEHDSVEVHFETGRVLLLGECLAASSPPWLLESQSVAELRVLELTRKKIDDLKFASTSFSMSLNLEVICAAERRVVRATGVCTLSYATFW